jgi:hypothetical protein
MKRVMNYDADREIVDAASERLNKEAEDVLGDQAAWARMLDSDRASPVTVTDRIMRVWSLSSNDLAHAFQVSPRTIRRWRKEGLPAGRRSAVRDLLAATHELERRISAERVGEVVWRPVPALGEHTLRDLARSGQHGALRKAVLSAFDLRSILP